MPFSAADEAFRQEVRQFIQENLPADVRQKVLSGQEIQKDDYMRWHKALAAKGWVAPNWPEEHGGCKWTAIQRFIFDDEAGLAGAPRLSGFGLGMVGPVLMKFGTEEQKREHLPKILSGERLWCQGYSEPGSGSDLASLKTKAERTEDGGYLINGSKIWTSLAHHADWIFCLVRTSNEPKKQDGISFLIFSMRTPGIEIRPIISLSGLHHLNQTFYTDVKVPATALVGEEGKGWTIAKHLLEHERISGGAVGELRTALGRVMTIAETERADGARLIDDKDFARRLRDVEAELMTVENVMLKALSAHSAAKGIGAVSSLIKVRRSEVQQMISELGVIAGGYYSQPYSIGALRQGWNDEPVGADYFNGLTPSYMFLRAASIYSGSNEIQRNIYAKRQLGL